MKNNCRGVFESMRYYNGRIVYFDEHLKRLKRSCRLLSMEFPYSLGKLRREVASEVKAICLKDAYVRLTLSKQGEKIVKEYVVKKYLPFRPDKYSQGYRAEIAKFKQNNLCLARIKTIERRIYESAFSRAKKNGLDEAIILNSRGYICEATRSNIFLVKADQLVTPRLECGCLKGITRKVIFDIGLKYNIKISQGSFTVEEMLAADEAFLTNSLMGVMPLVSVSGTPIAKGRPGKLTKLFIKKYGSILINGREEDKITI